MTDPLERTLVRSLAERVGGPVDTADLAASALRRGRSQRRRRQALAGFGAAVVVAAAGMTVLDPLSGGRVAGVPPQAGAVPVPGVPSSPPAGWRAPTPPVAVGVPGAAQTPDLVGADPGVLHFSVDGLTIGAERVTWAVESGSERVGVTVGGRYTEIALARDVGRLDLLVQGQDVDPTAAWSEPETSAATVGGLPATLYVQRSDQAEAFHLRWKPAPGVWAQVYGHGGWGRSAEAVSIAARVRLDTAARCAAPVRLPVWTHPDTPLGCRVTMAGTDQPDAEGRLTRLVEVVLTVGRRHGRVEVGVRRRSVDGTAAGERLGGRPAYRTTTARGEHRLVVPDFDGLRIELTASAGYAVPQVARVAAGLRLDGDPEEPATWPIWPSTGRRPSPTGQVD
ncbi:hypothetical protein [Plantactinospora sonchi]|uniref:Uncharacterized protein n=1 Tax=Plantactinospora sonchi TaxID=1544735 RepID=A0ABU7S4Y1_9ACTN